MRMLISDHYHTAKQSLERSRVRTLLTITGVAIGIASITAILALNAGVSNILTKQVAEADDTIAVVRPVAKEASLADLSNPIPQTAYSTSPITEDDLDDVSALPETDFAAPLMTISASLREKTSDPVNGILVATTPSLEMINDLQFEEGQFIDSVTNKNTVVVGSRLAIDLFGTSQAIGKNFLIDDQEFTIIGILKEQAYPINYSNLDFDRAAIISLETGKDFNGGVSQIQQINIRAHDGTDMANYVQTINEKLIENHNEQQSVEALAGKAITKPTSNLFRIITTTVSMVAGISLIVGGIGIMNIMLVGVSERTREIGLRKAVGASNGIIVSQFMIEALIISLLGGVAGFIAGYILAFGVSTYIPYDPAFRWSIVGWAAVLSLGVGSVFGLYPAIRAARKDPIESLRRYH